jgi:16S rRNA (cytidine1402-2'-O)-methyltransferase
VRRAPLSALARTFEEEPPKGEIVILVAPPGETDVSDATIESQLTAAVATLSMRDAVRVVSDNLKIPKARVYDLALALKKAQRSTDE